MQRAPYFAPGQCIVGGLRALIRAFRVQYDDSVERGIVPGDLCQVAFQHFHSGNLFLANGSGKFRCC